MLSNENIQKITESGFEGPEKLLEIWFQKPSAIPKNITLVPEPHGLLSSRDPSPVSSLLSGRSESNESFDSGVASLSSTAPAGGEVPPISSWNLTGLRTVDRAIWEDMLAIVKCQVLNVIRNECCDAYLLSESSMFVYPHRLILKTCGTTTLLHAVPRILEIAQDVALATSHFSGRPDAVFYSRKAFLYPDRQLWPHGRWGDEVAYMDDLFSSDRGYETSGYVVGKVNGDHWCLYLATPLDDFLLNENGEVDDHDSQDGSPGSDDEFEDEGDVTLEIMMQQLDPSVTKLFWRNEEELAEGLETPKVDPTVPSRAGDEMGGPSPFRRGERRILHQTGIAQIYPGSIVDDFLFNPCGYSLNGLMGSNYYTIHVTPEDFCSYASFETTIPVKALLRRDLHERHHHESVDDVVQKVVDCFRPGKFSVSLFTHRSHRKSADLEVREGRRRGQNGAQFLRAIQGFRHVDHIGHALGDWDLEFAHYVKGPPAGLSLKKRQ
ncbi:adenosylmethionine decarboxylase [Zopfochytrium polystomum]|nr:adenosylmethionine decarboxylase [Zopfochytrium polystomum]